MLTLATIDVVHDDICFVFGVAGARKLYLTHSLSAALIGKNFPNLEKDEAILFNFLSRLQELSIESKQKISSFHLFLFSK